MHTPVYYQSDVRAQYIDAETCGEMDDRERMLTEAEQEVDKLLKEYPGIDHDSDVYYDMRNQLVQAFVDIDDPTARETAFIEAYLALEPQIKAGCIRARQSAKESLKARFEAIVTRINEVIEKQISANPYVSDSGLLLLKTNWIKCVYGARILAIMRSQDGIDGIARDLSTLIYTDMRDIQSGQWLDEASTHLVWHTSGRTFYAAALGAIYDRESAHYQVPNYFDLRPMPRAYVQVIPTTTRH